jgi:SAM-dependent methyltransferase
MHHAPSPWIARWQSLVPAGSAVLDVAAGGGRHSLLFLRRGHPVTAVDRDVTALRMLPEEAFEVVAADLEHGPWPLPGRTFGGVVVCNYLSRPLLPTIVASVAAGGVLLYSTFAAGNEHYGKPRNPDFLLQPDELLDAVRGHLTVRAYEHGPEGEPVTAVRQSLCAVRP